VDNAGVVHVFSIAPADGSVSQIGTSEAAGNGATEIAIDPSGHFVIVTQSATGTNLPSTANQLTVFTFDPVSGAMKKLQSYPQPNTPGKVIVIARSTRSCRKNHRGPFIAAPIFFLLWPVTLPERQFLTSRNISYHSVWPF